MGDNTFNKKPLDDSLIDDASINFLINDYERMERQNTGDDESDYWRNFIELEGRINNSYDDNSVNDDIMSDDPSFP